MSQSAWLADLESVDFGGTGLACVRVEVALAVVAVAAVTLSESS